jgi:hypothetical protein
MTTVCMICNCVKSGSGEHISHGICYPCRELIYGVPSPPALPSGRKSSCDGCSGHKYVDYTYAAEPNGSQKRKRGWVCEYRPGWCQLEGRVI